MLIGNHRDDFVVARYLRELNRPGPGSRTSARRCHRSTLDRSCIRIGLEEDCGYGHRITLPADHRLDATWRCESDESSLGFSGVWTNRGMHSPTTGRPHANRRAMVATAALTIGTLSISIAPLPTAKGATTTGLAAQAAAIAGRVSAESSALST